MSHDRQGGGHRGRSLGVEEATLTANQVGVAVSRSAGVGIEGVRADANGSFGVEIGFSENTSVRHSTMNGNGFAGFDAIGSSSTTVEHSRAEGNAFFGLRLLHEQGATVRRIDSHGNGGTGIEVGFDTVGALVERSAVTGNVGFGIVVVEDGNVLRRNHVSGNAEGDCEPATACD